MLTKFYIVLTYVIAGASVVGAYTQVSALHLGQTQQSLYFPRYNMVYFGPYRSNRFQPLTNRSSYSGFRGGGNFSGK